MTQGIFLIIGLIALSDLCDTANQLLLKLSVNTVDLHIDTVRKALRLMLQLIRMPRIWLSFIFSIISLVVWLFVLTKSGLSLAFSLDSMRYIMIALASMFFLKEEIGPTRWLGIICVAAGIILVAG